MTKIDERYNNDMDAAKATGLNIFDLVRIPEAFVLSYDFMFTSENRE